MSIPVLDLFSAAAGGWSLGMHRAGYTTMAACEAVDWRRALYAQNNPGIRIYDDVRTLTASRLLADHGYLPRVVVGSPPCQDISSANTSGKGVDGERSGLFFEAVRIIGEIRDLARDRGESGARWFALENSANLRTRGADRVIAALAAIGYTCWPFVVGADDCGANHERKRSWLIGCDLEQIADADGFGRDEGRCRRRGGFDVSVPADHLDAESIGHEGRRPRGHGPDGDGAAYLGDAPQDGRRPGLSGRRAEPASRAQLASCGDDYLADAVEERPQDGTVVGRVCSAAESEDGCPVGRSDEVRNSPDPDHGNIGPGHVCKHGIRWPHPCDPCDDAAWAERNSPNPDQARQAHGCVEPGVRQAEIAVDGCGDGRRADGSCERQMGIRSPDCGGADGPWPLWSLDDLAGRLRLDDGLPARVAGTRIAVGGTRGTVAASLIVEAYGDAVIPQIPEAIGRAILRVEEALRAVSATPSPECRGGGR